MHSRIGFSALILLTLLAASLAIPATPARAANGQWTLTGPLVNGHGPNSVAVRLTDGRILVAGGGGPSADIYDPATDSWVGTSAMVKDHGVGAFTMTLLAD